jgi:hypothetical protein
MSDQDSDDDGHDVMAVAPSRRPWIWFRSSAIWWQCVLQLNRRIPLRIGYGRYCDYAPRPRPRPPPPLGAPRGLPRPR